MSHLPRRLTYIAAVALAIAALVVFRSESVSERAAPGEAAQAPGAAGEAAVSSPAATLDSLGRGLSIDDRPDSAAGSGEVRSAIPSALQPHTIREPDLDLPQLKAPIDPSATAAARGAGPSPDKPGTTGVRIAGGAIGAAAGGPATGDFHDPGMPPEYGAPAADVPDEDLVGIDVVVSSPDADVTQVPVGPIEDAAPAADDPAPEDSDPGIDYPAPEDSGA